jgi:hypothetical protein
MLNQSGAEGRLPSTGGTHDNCAILGTHLAPSDENGVIYRGDDVRETDSKREKRKEKKKRRMRRKWDGCKV